MLKYVDTKVTFSEIPDEIALAVNISGCPCRCAGCHSSYLWEDIGEDFTEDALSELISENVGVTAVCLMGGDADPDAVALLAKRAKLLGFKVCWYSGKPLDNESPVIPWLDYIKVGPYMDQLGGLDKNTTNQRFYRVIRNKERGHLSFEDMTYKFRNRAGAALPRE